MKKLLVSLLLSIIAFTDAYSTGVCVVNVEKMEFLDLTDTKIACVIENQIAQVSYKETFKNTLGKDVNIKYAFPLPENASSISLQWKVLGRVYYASLRGTPQDSTLPGQSGNNYRSEIDKYLGTFPVYFEISTPIPKDSTVSFSITYVELLKYEFGKVKVNCPYNYEMFQNKPIENLEFKFLLNSSRTVDSIQFVNKPDEIIWQHDSLYHFSFISDKFPIDEDINIEYTLSPDELGMFGLSTYYDYPIDTLGKGYFLFVVEPDPTEDENVLPKVFTLIIDRSGSMGGNKIVQARDAAKYIINNMNHGDYFNIVDFETTVSSFKQYHVDFNSNSKTEALNYIDKIYAGGSTNISGAFDLALNQFQKTNDKTNIIMFFTDGQQTAGITNTETLIDHIRALNLDKEVSIFSFGIGPTVNEQLLNQIATQNYGICELLKDNELYEKLTNFYQKIRNPVLTNSNVEFIPDEVFEVYPKYLPNLYKGQQMIISGRYSSIPDNLKVKFSGKRGNEDAEYSYDFKLSDSFSNKGFIIGKTWAKMKIEYLLSKYYSYSSSSNEARNLKDEIIKLSLDYEILTLFTSYHESGGGTVVPVELTYFKADAKQSGIQLFWETASEINNYGFYIDRKIEDNNWENIGFVKGYGNTNTIHYYQYFDSDVKCGNKYYYRLRQIDLDGSFDPELEYRVIEIDFNYFDLVSFENIGPNPFTYKTSFKLNAPTDAKAQINIFDLNGKHIKTIFNGFIDQGQHEIIWDRTNNTRENVPSGVYIYYAIIAGKTYSGKMIVF